MKAFLFDSSGASRLNFLGFDSTMLSMKVKDKKQKCQVELMTSSTLYDLSTGVPSKGYWQSRPGPPGPTRWSAGCFWAHWWSSPFPPWRLHLLPAPARSICDGGSVLRSLLSPPPCNTAASRQQKSKKVQLTPWCHGPARHLVSLPPAERDKSLITDTFLECIKYVQLGFHNSHANLCINYCVTESVAVLLKSSYSFQCPPGAVVFKCLHEIYKNNRLAD